MVNPTFDPSVTIEGVATALGVVGAATGYLVNLVRGWRLDRKNARYRGTKLVILQLLKEQLPKGISEIDLWSRYNSGETEAIRKKYGAWKPKKLGVIGLERELKQLQLDFLIDLIDRDTYRLRYKPVDSYEKEEREKTELSEFLRGFVNEDKISETALRVFITSKSSYEKEDAARLLMKLRDEKGMAKVVEALDSEDSNTAIQIAETALRILRQERR